VALIALNEGPWLMSRAEGLPPETARIGMAVRACSAEDCSKPLLVFDVAEDNA
jgi:uncharacterized OB-fold protein